LLKDAAAAARSRVATDGADRVNCRQKMLDSPKMLDNPPRELPAMADCLVEARVIRNRMLIEIQDTRFIQVQAVNVT
jgi:hypothetical protein